MISMFGRTRFSYEGAEYLCLLGLINTRIKF